MEHIEFTEPVKTDCQVHLLPFKIQYTGEAHVNSYFSSSTTVKSVDSNKNEIVENSFRGRPLNGIKVNLDKNQEGLIVNDNGEKNYELSGKFRGICSWHLDEPNLTIDKDLLNKTKNEWFNIAKIIHSD
ncbi:ribonuclease H2 subunit C-like [Brachionus plicatilis]|uniref:Ribonuclease H2 subunit C-like n=1 Tax=Brachionus plicatilis TaxID=10195 RepID=A0A3M7RD44_BRAPC|nr:ribonuclease H2 subunit C-like [Brachionus plicatilis]